MRTDPDLGKDVAHVVPKTAVIDDSAERDNLIPVGRILCDDVYRVDFGVFASQILKEMIGVVPRVHASFRYDPKILISGGPPEKKARCFGGERRKKDPDIDENSSDFIHKTASQDSCD